MKKSLNSIQFISLFYLLMALSGLGLIEWRKESFAADPLALPGSNWFSALLLSGAMIAAVHLLSRIAHAKLPSLKKGAADIRRFFGDLNDRQILIVALMSGIGEEILFRGWLYHEAGLWISSIIFGIVHFPPNRRWIYWPFFAAAIGILLGWIYGWSGSLLFPILIHAGVNFLNLRTLIESD